MSSFIQDATKHNATLSTTLPYIHRNSVVMSLIVLERALLAQTQELPEEAVRQLIDFAQFLSQKRSNSVGRDPSTVLMFSD